jgi:hypothetical protein
VDAVERAAELDESGSEGQRVAVDRRAAARAAEAVEVARQAA